LETLPPHLPLLLPSPASSIDSILASREPTPEWDPTTAYEALAPLHWDAEEFDSGTISEEDKPKTEGEDLRLLFQEESESSDEEDPPSSDGVDSSSEEEIDSPNDGDEPMGGKPLRFLRSSEEDSEEENSGGDDDGWSDLGSEGSSSAFSSDDNDDDDSDDGSSGDVPARSPKRHRY
jgi:hypothetical protein